LGDNFFDNRSEEYQIRQQRILHYFQLEQFLCRQIMSQEGRIIL